MTTTLKTSEKLKDEKSQKDKEEKDHEDLLSYIARPKPLVKFKFVLICLVLSSLLSLQYGLAYYLSETILNNMTY